MENNNEIAKNDDNLFGSKTLRPGLIKIETENLDEIDQQQQQQL